MMPSKVALDEIRQKFGSTLREDEPLARYTSARIGASADFLIEVSSSDELANAAEWLWQKDWPFLVLGGGSNSLISDKGVREVVILNLARHVEFKEGNKYLIWAESGANLGVIARQSASKGFSGLEWAAGIPGSIGGAVVGNAGAHGGDISQILALADILHRAEGRESLSNEEMLFSYRTSRLKKERGKAVLLAVELQLLKMEEEKIREKMDTFLAYRRLTQPPGASMGSMFKNPSGDYAGRLIESAGLKGQRVGDAQISPLHANFFINLGGARAADVYALINMAREAVAKNSGIELELEIGLVGEWDH